MIPTFGAMIGGFRCIEALCRNADQLSSEAGRITVQVFPNGDAGVHFADGALAR
jgi:hypothetical protein